MCLQAKDNKDYGKPQEALTGWRLFLPALRGINPAHTLALESGLQDGETMGFCGVSHSLCFPKARWWANAPTFRTLKHFYWKVWIDDPSG